MEVRDADCVLQTIIGSDVASFLSIPILHTHQEKTRVLKRRKTSSIFYEPEKEAAAPSGEFQFLMLVLRD